LSTVLRFEECESTLHDRSMNKCINLPPRSEQEQRVSDKNRRVCNCLFESTEVNCVCPHRTGKPERSSGRSNSRTRSKDESHRREPTHSTGRAAVPPRKVPKTFLQCVFSG